MNTSKMDIMAISNAIADLRQRIATVSPELLPSVVSQLNDLLNKHATLISDSVLIQDNKSEIVLNPGVNANDVAGSIVTGNNNSVIHIHRMYQRGAEQPYPIDEADLSEALGRYLGWVERRYGRLDLRGVENREHQVLSLTLKDVYVSLAALVNRERRKPSNLPLQEVEENLEPIDMRHLLTLSSRIVIVGGPGCGKTTFLRLIATSVSRALRLNRPETVLKNLGLAEPLPLPVVVSLSDYNQYRRRNTQSDDPRRGTLISFINHSLIRQQAAIGLPEDFFERLLMQEGNCLLLLDGLDEVANERERSLVRRAVEELAINDNIHQILVTSRSQTYQGESVLPEEFRIAKVQPMTSGQVSSLVEKWCHAVYGSDDALKETYRLQAAIERLEQHRVTQSEQRQRLTQTPLLVTIIAIVHYNKQRLPDQRAELYEKCVEVLLTESHHSASDATYELADWGGTPTEKRDWLAKLAFEMMNSGGAIGRSASQEQIETWLLPQLKRRYGEAESERQLGSFIQAIRERGSLLNERGGEYQFTHFTFQEFLCTYHLAETVRDPKKMVALWAEANCFSNDWWRETILLTAGYLSLKSMDITFDLIRNMTTFQGWNLTALAAAELAGVAFLELKGHDEDVRTSIINQLVALLTVPELANPRLRLLAGNVLGRLGDPRPGVCTLEPSMINIPAGPFLMGEEKHTIYIREPYAIARYPITNAQYKMFIDDGGYTEKWQQCWTIAGWQEREEQGWSDLRHLKTNLDFPNHPVTGLSWYEAVAFSNWLAASTNKPYRLPTAAEWERAARHTDGRTYPWGEVWQDGIANTKEAELHKTTAVGVFPMDKAPCGAQDMGGNIGEWCQTRTYDEQGNKYPDPYNKYDGRESLQGGRTIFRQSRGGDWNNLKEWSRCSAYLDNSPFDGSYGNSGFRVVLSI